MSTTDTAGATAQQIIIHAHKLSRATDTYQESRNVWVLLGRLEGWWSINGAIWKDKYSYSSQMVLIAFV
jgi:hypothetical protein